MPRHHQTARSRNKKQLYSLYAVAAARNSRKKQDICEAVGNLCTMVVASLVWSSTQQSPALGSLFRDRDGRTADASDACCDHRGTKFRPHYFRRAWVLEPQSHLGDKPLKLLVLRPRNGTGVLKGVGGRGFLCEELPNLNTRQFLAKCYLSIPRPWELFFGVNTHIFSKLVFIFWVR